jgi:pimeloyl-ACP methyl ester carboxylesterase
MSTAATGRLQPLDVPTGSVRTVAGAGGMPIATHEYGDPQGRTVLFIHGFCQSHLCWHEQYTDPALAGLRMVALDLRGHGDSGRAVPEGGAAYAPSDYAEDVKAVIDELALRDPVLVGWSYGGLVIADYVRTFGTAGISGAVFAGAACRLNPPAHEDTFIGPGFLENGADLLSGELEAFIRGTVNFLNACIREPLPPERFAWHLAYNMIVPAANRFALLGRGPERFDEEVLPSFDKPALVIHGRDDQVVLVGAAGAIAGAIKRSELRVYENCGHAPFYEQPAAFNRDLLAFL